RSGRRQVDQNDAQCCLGESISQEQFMHAHRGGKRWSEDRGQQKKQHGALPGKISVRQRACGRDGDPNAEHGNDQGNHDAISECAHDARFRRRDVSPGPRAPLLREQGRPIPSFRERPEPKESQRRERDRQRSGNGGVGSHSFQKIVGRSTPTAACAAFKYIQVSTAVIAVIKTAMASASGRSARSMLKYLRWATTPSIAGYWRPRMKGTSNAPKVNANTISDAG